MRIAVIQMVSQSDVLANIEAAEQLIELAVKKDADCVVLPENFAVFGRGNMRSEAELEHKGWGPILPFLSRVSKELRIWLIGGTIPFVQSLAGKAAELEKVYTSVPVFNPDGELVSRYDKIHLFDAGVDDEIGSYNESRNIQPGDTPIVFETPWGPVGIAVCYDLRFPEYFRLLVERGAKLIIVPSAFTHMTGRDHWIPLIQARAIENQVFIVAANQGGWHDELRRTWGHSCIVGPWGNCIAGVEEGEAVVVATINFDEQDELRQKMPVLRHRKF